MDTSINGDIQRVEPETDGMLFGEVAKKWAKQKVKRVKSSSWRDYKSIMKKFGYPLKAGQANEINGLETE